jgi:filamentous hemagglutinin
MANGTGGLPEGYRRVVDKSTGSVKGLADDGRIYSEVARGSEEVLFPVVKVDPAKSVKGSAEYEALNTPKKDTVYELTNGTTYRTNEFGMVEELSFTPNDVKVPRDSRQTAAGKQGKSTDVGGHAQACSQGGTCDGYNLFAQDGNFNNSAYKVFYENVIKKAIDDPNRTVGETTIKFDRTNPASPRPDRLTVTYIIDGEPTTVHFKNEANGTPKAKKP